MNSDLIFGLELSVIGLGVTFLALGVVILLIKLLLAVFPDEEEKLIAQQTTIEASAADVSEQQLEEMAVALAVGLSLLERSGALESHDPSLGKLLEH